MVVVVVPAVSIEMNRSVEALPPTLTWYTYPTCNPTYNYQRTSKCVFLGFHFQKALGKLHLVVLGAQGSHLGVLFSIE